MSQILRCLPPDPVLFAPFGRFVTAPDRPGERAFFSDHLGASAPNAAPVLHVNKVAASTLPFRLTSVERHPNADQIFIPLDVSRYLAIVMPSDRNGDPVPAGARAFLLPSTLGVAYRTAVWHAGATALDRVGSFAVLMWRGAEVDDEFRTIEPLTVEAARFEPAAAEEAWRAET